MSIFVVLETIIDRVSDNLRWRDKLLMRKGSGGDDISDAIEAMEERVEEFRDEVNVCLQAKIGRIGDDVVAIRQGLSQVLKRFDGKSALDNLLRLTHVRAELISDRPRQTTSSYSRAN